MHRCEYMLGFLFPWWMLTFVVECRSAAEPDRATWKKAFQLFVQAFREPAQESEKKKLARVLKKPIPQEVLDELFEYDAFLRGLGRMSLSTSPSSPLHHSPQSLTGAPRVLVQIWKPTAACTSCTRTSTTRAPRTSPPATSTSAPHCRASLW